MPHHARLRPFLRAGWASAVLVGCWAGVLSLASASEPRTKSVSTKATAADGDHARVQELLASRDPAVIPELTAFLQRDEPKLQRAVAMGIMETFPDRAVGLFVAMLDDESPVVRRAAVHVLGHVTDRDLLPILVQSLSDPDPSVRTGVAYAFGRRAGQGARDVVDVVRGESKSLPPRIASEMESMRALLLESIDTHGLTNEQLRMLWRLGDHRTAGKLADLYAADGEPGRALLPRLVRANRRWLGHVTPPPVDRVSYTLRVRRPDRLRPQVVPVVFTPTEMDLMRPASKDRLDRGSQLSMPLDGLVSVPQLAGPRVRPTGEGRAVLSFRTAELEPLDVGFGLIGSYLWRSALPQAATSSVVIDTVRAVPLTETLQDAAGVRLAELTYGDYQSIDGDAWVPGTITIDVPAVRVADATRHLRYSFRFQVSHGAWLLRDAQCVELKPEGDVVLATAEIADLSITPRAEASVTRSERN